MADNYLERKREEYEKKKALWLKNKKRTGSRRPSDTSRNKPKT